MHGRPRRALIGAVACLAMTVTAMAGSQSQPRVADTPLDAVELPVSLERIKQQLERLPVARDERDVLRLSFYVRVYGRAPRVNVFEGFDLHNGPVPYGAPTHAAMRDVTTPVEFRAPAVSLGNVIGWTWGRRR